MPHLATKLTKNQAVQSIAEISEDEIDLTDFPSVNDESLDYLTKRLYEYENKLKTAEEKNINLEYYLNELHSDLENRAPIIARQKQDYELLSRTYNDLLANYKKIMNDGKFEDQMSSHDQESHRRIEKLKKEKKNLAIAIENCLIENHRSLTGNVINPTGSYSNVYELVQENSKLKVKIDEINKIVAKLKEEIAENNRIVDTKDANLELLERNINNYRSRLEVLTIDEKFYEDTSLESQLYVTKHENKVLNLKLAKLESQSKYQEKRIEFIQEKLTKLSQENEDLRFANKDSAGLCASFKNTTISQLSEIRSLKDKVLMLQQKNQELALEKNKLSEIYKTLELKLNQKSTMFTGLVNRSSEVTSYFKSNEKQLMSEYQRWNQEIIKLNSEIEKLDPLKYTPFIDEIKAELKKTQQKLILTNDELIKERQISEKLSKEVSKTRPRVRKIENLNMIIKDLDLSHKKFVNLEQKLHEIVHNKSIEIEDLKKYQNSLEERLEQSKVSDANEKKKYEFLEDLNSHLQNQIKILNEEKHNLNLKVLHYKSQLEQYEKVRKEIRNNLIDPENRLRLQEECMNLTLENDRIKQSSEKEKKSFLFEIQKLKQDLQQESQKIPPLQLQIKALETDNLDVKTSLESLRSSIPLPPNSLRALVSLLHKSSKK